jgi:hypothetical protein
MQNPIQFYHFLNNPGATQKVAFFFYQAGSFLLIWILKKNLPVRWQKGAFNNETKLTNPTYKE